MLSLITVCLQSIRREVLMVLNLYSNIDLINKILEMKTRIINLECEMKWIQEMVIYCWDCPKVLERVDNCLTDFTNSF